MDIQLFVKNKSDGAVRTFKLPGSPAIVIGRNPEAVVALEGSLLSRDHFSIEYRGGTVYVTDTSSNGTWVNGDLIGRGKTRAVGVTDMVEVAGYEINYKLIGAPAQAGSSTAAPRHGSAWSGFIQQASHMIGPFGGAEKFAVLLVLCATALTLIYFNS